MTRAVIPKISPNFGSDDFQDNIHRYYRDYILHSPVFMNDEGVVFLTRYDDCAKLLGGKQFKRTPPGGAGPFSKAGATPSTLEKNISLWMLFMDQPRHDVVRKAFSLPFTPKAVAALEPFILDRTHKLLRKAIKCGDVELLRSFSYPLPVMVIAEILGVPEQDMDLFYDWSIQLTMALDAATPEGLQSGGKVVESMTEYFAGLIARADTLPEHCLIRMLHRDPMQLTAAELNSGFIFLLWSGHETTKNLISNGIQLLAEHPQSFAALKRNPDLITTAVEEMLRYDTPVQKISRWTHEDESFGEYTVPAGTMITVLIGAANQDAAVFKNPERFDIERVDNRHLAFGLGLHHCLGSMLARMEARIALKAFLTMVKEVRPLRHRWRTYSAFRSLDELAVEIIPE